MVQGRHQTYCKHNGSRTDRSPVSAASSPPSPQPPPSPPSPPWQRATSTPTPPAPEKGKKKTSSLPLTGPTKKKQKMVEKKIASRKKLAYKMTDEETHEEVATYVKEQLKPKVPEKRVPIDPEVAAKVLASVNNPPPQKKTLGLRPDTDKDPPAEK